MLQFCLITNLFKPEDEAVRRSPLPRLLTTSPAKLVLPEKEAIGRVLELPRTSSLAAMTDEQLEEYHLSIRRSAFALGAQSRWQMMLLLKLEQADIDIILNLRRPRCVVVQATFVASDRYPKKTYTQFVTSLP